MNCVFFVSTTPRRALHPTLTEGRYGGSHDDDGRRRWWSARRGDGVDVFAYLVDLALSHREYLIKRKNGRQLAYSVICLNVLGVFLWKTSL